MMESRLRAYIDELFADAPDTRRALELKDEVTQNVIDRYRDMTGQGREEEDAYNTAVASIGDINVLLRELEGELSPREQKLKERSAVLMAIAIVLYIVSLVPPIMIGGNGGAALMFTFVAIATGLIVYSNMIKPKYRRSDDTVVEEFREWQNHSDSRASTYKAINSAIWSITLALYFIISFMTRAWYITWVIFIIGAAVTQIVKAIFEARG